MAVARVALLVCLLVVDIHGYESFDDGYGGGSVGLSGDTMSNHGFKVVPLVQKLVNVYHVNNVGTVTVNEMQKLLNSVTKRVNTLKNSNEGHVVLTEITRLSDTVNRSQQLLSRDPSVIKLGIFGTIVRHVVDFVTGLKDTFSKSVKLSMSEKDLYLDVMLSGSMGKLYKELRDVLYSPNNTQVADKDAHKLLYELTLTQTLSKAFKKLRSILTAGTKYAKPSDDNSVSSLKGGEVSSSYYCLRHPGFCYSKFAEDDGVIQEQESDSDNKETKRPKKKKLCLFHLRSQYCILQESSVI